MQDMWTVTTTAEFDRWFGHDLVEEEREEIAAVVSLLKLFGPMPIRSVVRGTRT